MIVVDTSALMAILLGEPEGGRFEKVAFDSGRAVVAAPTAFEFLMVGEARRASPHVPEPRLLLDSGPFSVVAWEPHHARLAHEAFVRFGKGRHPAALNFGDCMAYALAQSLDAPLLFKGEDFARTDVKRAV